MSSDLKSESAAATQSRGSQSRRANGNGETDDSPRNYLTPEEVVKRYRSQVTEGTLRNWRALGVGPDYVKIGKGVLYPLEKLQDWEELNVVRCASAGREKAPSFARK